MKLPFVSRLAFDAVASERDHLRAEVNRLTDALTRIGRREVGLSEVPRGPRPEIGTMSDGLRQKIAGAGDRSIRHMMTREALLRRQRGESWEEIERDALKPQKEPVP